MSTCRDSSNLVADRFAAGLGPARELVCDLLASWIAPDRPNSITLCSSLADCRPAREPASELNSIMEFGLYTPWIMSRFASRETIGRALKLATKQLHGDIFTNRGSQLASRAISLIRRTAAEARACVNFRPKPKIQATSLSTNP